MGPPARGTGLGIGGIGRPALPGQGMGSFGMGQFGSGSITRGTTSEERYNRSLGQGRLSGMARTPSQGGPSQMPMHGLPPMAPSASRGGTNRSQRGARRLPQERPGMQLDPDVAPLAVSQNSWVKARPTDTDEKSPAFIERKVKSLLNKLTQEKFDSISNQILEYANRSREETDGLSLKLVIKLVFEKATDEAHWSAMYARLCRKLLDCLDPSVTEELEGKPVSGGTLFRKYLIGRCQMDFEAGWRAREDAATAAAAKSKEDKELLAQQEKDKAEGKEPTGEAVMLSDEYYAAQKAKRRGLGLVQLIGELYKLEMISNKVIRTCLIRLLGNATDPDEEDIESTVKLLTTIGEQFEAQSPENMNSVFARLHIVLEVEGLPSRIRFMVMVSV
jgi:translation initiation factor 4G